MKITKTPPSKSAFVASAKAITIVAKMPDGEEVVLGTAEPREFSSGSVGWYMNGKGCLPWDDEYQAGVQAGINLIVVHSKDLPAEEPRHVNVPPKSDAATPWPQEQPKRGKAA